jgi:D-amino peptidase
MLSGVAAGVDAVCFVGYHGRAGTARSVLAHTMSGATVRQVRCDGRELGEVGLNAALAAHYGAVPVLATGDDTLASEALRIAPGITTVVVKTALGTRAAESLHPAEACARIEAAAEVALERIGEVEPPRFDGPVDLEVDVLRPHMTELACLVPGVEQRGPLTLGYCAADFASAYDLIEVFTVLAGAG